MAKSKVRNLILLVFVLVLVMTYVARVAVVNGNAVHVPTYIYEKGEVVDFGYDYIDTIDECIPGYAMQVLGYELIDTKDLYERYNLGTIDENGVANTPFYCLVKVRFYNKDCYLGETGGIALQRYALEGDDYMVLVSENVFCSMYPDMPDTSFSLKKGTSMEFDLPYPISAAVGKKKADLQRKPPMLEITEFPNRRLLKVQEEIDNGKD